MIRNVTVTPRCVTKGKLHTPVQRQTAKIPCSPHVPAPGSIYMEHIGIGSVWTLKGNIEERACELANYIIENRTTVREAAKRFGISKSTVHMDGVK